MNVPIDYKHQRSSCQVIMVQVKYEKTAFHSGSLCGSRRITRRLADQGPWTSHKVSQPFFNKGEQKGTAVIFLLDENLGHFHRADADFSKKPSRDCRVLLLKCLFFPEHFQFNLTLTLSLAIASGNSKRKHADISEMQTVRQIVRRRRKGADHVVSRVLHRL